jgi:crotonobetainyl-CoA:carnitine CoA-transferase CaiB-like acyl-CoA transferase
LPYEQLEQLMAVAGEPSAKGLVEFNGRDPIFPTPMRIGDLGAATIGASAVQAARLWQMRTGRMQDVRVDVDAAAIAMRASRYIRREVAPGETAAIETGRTSVGGLQGYFRTKDERWIYFQRLFEHHRLATASVLHCEDENEALAKAVAGWNSFELEEAIVAAGATCAVVRSHEEWAKHEQAKALAKLPLFEVLRIGDSPPEPLPNGDRPLAGIRVLDVTRVLAGPTCGRTLAEHGADVLRIGTPRYPDNELMMRDTGHGKRSAVLDLATPEGAERLRELARDADVFAQGYRPGTIAERGFSPEDLMASRPGIIYVTLSAFGHEGPWRDRRGFDSVVQAASGIADECGTEEMPRSAPANPLDYATGYMAAFGVMVALGRRAREGGSYLVRVSLAQTGRWLAGMQRPDLELMKSRPAELPKERMDELMISRDTPFGRLRYFGPVAQLGETPGRWDRPTVPLDHDPPVWV